MGIAKKLEMLPLTEPQMWEFVQKRLSETSGELWRQIKGRLRDLTETPLLLKLLCDVFEQNGEIPINRGDLFRKEFARRYEEFKPERLRNVSEDSRRFTFDLLSYLAFTMVQGDPHTDPCKPSASWVTIPKTQAEKILATFLAGDNTPDVAVMQKAKEWLEDLVEWHLLQVASNPEHLEFHHQLFQEYYAAEWLVRQLAELNDEELKYYYLNYLKWTEPLAMAMTFVESEALVVRIVRLAMKVDLQLGAKLAGGVKPEHQDRTVSMITDLNIPEKFKIKLLGMTNSDASIPFLNQALENSSDYFTKNEVADALEKIYSLASIPLLKRIIENADSQLMFKIACTLAHYGDETAIPILWDGLNNKESHIRAIFALEEINREIMITGLHEILQTGTSEIRQQAVLSLHLLLKRGYENILPLLIKVLDDENSQVRYQAAFALKNEGEEEVLSALGKLWKDENISVRMIFSLVFKGQERENLISEITKCLLAESSVLRKQAAETLGIIGTKSQSAIEVLFNVAFSDQDFLVRNSASTAMIQIGNSTVIQTLSEILEQEEIEVIQYTSNHSLAVIILMQIPSRETIPILSRVLKDNNKSFILRGNAAKALGNIGDFSVIDILVEIFNNEEAEYVIFHALFALGKLGIENLETAIAIGLKHPDPSIRQEAVETLAIIGTDAASSGLIQVLTDEDFSVRFTAACALGRNGEQAAIPVLVEALGYRNCIGWEDSKVCEDAIEVLICIGEAVLPALEKALNTLDYQVKRNAEKAIRKLITPVTANLLTDAFDSDEVLAFDSLNHELADRLGNIYKISDLTEIVLSSSDDPWEAISKLNEIASPENISQFYKLIFEAQSNNIFKYFANIILSIQSRCQFYNYDIFEHGTHTHTQNYANSETLKQQISGQQRKQLQDALVDAFPTKSSLEQMLSFGLNKKLAAIAGEGNLQEIVFNILKEAEAQGWIKILVHAARHSNPGNSKLQAIAQMLGSE
ncbi:HEAT repeat domain-containing protein [Scytonema sp. NUACC21]